MVEERIPGENHRLMVAVLLLVMMMMMCGCFSCICIFLIIIALTYMKELDPDIRYGAYLY